MRVHFEFVVYVSGIFVIVYFNTSLCIDTTLDIIPVNFSEFTLGIVGGTNVAIEQYPFAVLIFNTGAMCAGSILNSWSVLSAAHCFEHNDDPDQITLHAGASSREDMEVDLLPVRQVVVHKEFNKAMPFSCDIAMVFVEKSFEFGPRIQKAVLVNSNKWMDSNERDFTVIGWGMDEYNGELTENLQRTYLRYIPSHVCGRLHGVNLGPEMFCLYGDGKYDTCKGDSGGPVLWEELQVGIVSHGEKCAGKPSIYMNVWYFRQWIKKTIENYFITECDLRSSRKTGRHRRPPRISTQNGSSQSSGSLQNN